MIKLDKSKVTRNLGNKGYKYVPYLERAIKDFEEEWGFSYKEKQADHHWHPSSHCLQPPTELYAIATGQFESTPIPSSLRKVFMIGHFWHQWLQHITLHKLEFCDADAIERHASKEWGKGKYHSVAGSGDIAPCVCPDWEGLVDYKTMNPRNYAQPGVPEGPHRYGAKYECQMNIYMYLFDIEEAMVVAIDKESGEFKEFLYKRNDDLINEIVGKWEFVSACLDSDEIPTQADNDMFNLEPLLTGPVSS